MAAENIPIELYCRVLLELVESSGESEQREFMLVTAKQADFQSGLLDENTPLARALLGHLAGDVVPYRLGDLKEVRILKVEAVRKAAEQSEITSQMIFSTASGSKWGDYEVNMDKLLDQDEPQDDG